MSRTVTPGRMNVVHERGASLGAAAIVAAIALTAAILLAMGRPPICACGTVKLWHGLASSPETSQHLADWYTPSHVIHGFLFYGAAWLVGRIAGRPVDFMTGLVCATLAECAWEIAENTPAVIERYRATTIALGYSGDSVLNSVADILAMVLGYGLAARLPVAATVTLAFAMEAGVAYAIRDNLTLNVVMLLFPLESIRAWQEGG